MEGVSAAWLRLKALMEELKELLMADGRFVDNNNNLLKNRIVELALKLDKNLIKLLLKNERIKKHFFENVDGVLVFDREKFMKFVDNKKFLPDSYTAFKNKIGLANEEGKYLAKSKEVVLVWPYKDCVLEGGQEKTDEKRKEIFHNVILAPDEIDRLLEPKVFTNFKRIDAQGEHKLDSFKRDAEINRKRGLPEDTITDNLIIKGNNLLVLHSLLKEFRGKVKLIYIDPPYNTGNDEFRYNDNFNHSTWLTFMKNRLEVAKKLLKNDGVIFVHCDDNEQAYLKILMDEIFGRNNFISTIVAMTNRSGRDYGGIARTHDYMLVYGKTENYVLYGIEDKNKALPYKDKFGEFDIRELRNRNIRFNIENRPNLFYPFYVNPSKKDENGFYELSLEKREGWIEVLPKKSQGVQTVWRWGKEKAKKELNINLVGKKMRNGGFQIVEKYRKKEKMARSIWTEKEIRNEKGTLELKELFSGRVFDYPKAEELIKKVVEMGTMEGDLFLDFCLGSGTSASVAHKMGRQYIGVEQMDYINMVTVERIKKVIRGEQGGISKEVGWKGGGSFVYMELMKLNEVFVEKIRDAETTDKLLKIWEDMKHNGFLSYRVNPKLFDENIEEFKTLNLDEQKKLLLEMLDYNDLYVNYSEIDDAIYNVSEEDKKLNRAFYRGKKNA